MYCAVVDDGGAPRRDAQTKEVISHVPFTWWWPPGEAPRRPKHIQPADARPEAP